MDDRGQEAAFLQTLTLLYVEDEPNSREEMARFLRRRCGTVVTAADGVDGLAAFKAQPAQIVVTDIQMPNLNGSLDQLIQNTVQETLDGSLTTQAFHSRAGEVPVNYMEANLAHAFRIVAQNAREAMPAGGTLHVSTEICTIPEPRQPNILPGRYLQIGFRDTGPGVRPEHLPKVFDPVFSTKERSQQGGAGLGLASCEAIIRAHGGFMTADSQPGQGAMFQIYLPFALEKRRCSREG